MQPGMTFLDGTSIRAHHKAADAAIKPTLQHSEAIVKLLTDLVTVQGTDTCMVADRTGHAVAFRIAPGQAHELPHAVPLMNRLSRAPKRVVADRRCSSHAFRRHIWDVGGRPAVALKRNKAPVACPDWMHTSRNVVERL